MGGEGEEGETWGNGWERKESDEGENLSSLLRCS